AEVHAGLQHLAHGDGHSRNSLRLRLGLPRGSPAFRTGTLAFTRGGNLLHEKHAIVTRKTPSIQIFPPPRDPARPAGLPRNRGGGQAPNAIIPPWTCARTRSAS